MTTRTRGSGIGLPVPDVTTTVITAEGVATTMADDRTYAFEGAIPEIDADAHVSREATLVGDVAVGPDASVWPGAVLRGDVAPVALGRGAHVGDNAVLHASTVGERSMIGHGSVLNDAAVAEGVLVGFNATLISEATIGSGSIVATGTVVPAGYDVPPESFVRGTPARATPLEETTVDPEALFERYSSGAYTDLAEHHGELFD
jgi:carbonic anhydrase/acetyltransferase-like protein (isoleucine patch superfamily)